MEKFKNIADKISIQPMTISDLESIFTTLETDFDNFWNYNILKSELENCNSKYWVAKLNNKIVGFAGIIPILDEADITNIVVHKDFRNQKIGSLLLENLISMAHILNIKLINLEVRRSNIPAINLYKKYGFTICGCRKKYYHNSEDAILMQKQII